MDFQNGLLKGFDDLHAAVRDLQDGKCMLCKNEIQDFHHIVPRSRHGSNTIGNIAGLCTKCHEKVHKDEKAEKRLKDKKKGLDKKYGALSILNQAIPFICKELETEFGKEHVHYCTGRETALVRRSLRYHKTKEEQYHEVDAWCIGALSLDRIPEKAPAFEEVHTIMQFRRQDRASIKAQTSRTYKLDGETVAWNRKKRTDQKNDSLEDWYQKQVQLHGQKEADRMRSRLTVKISQRRYNNLERMLPGAVFLYKGKRYVMKGQHSNGKYLRAVGDGKTNYPVKECRIGKRNQGLVFID